MAYPGTLQIDHAAPYETSTDQFYPRGQKAEAPDGSIFRYTLMGSTVGVANKLYQSSIPAANWITQTHTVALAVGDTELSFDDGGTAFTVNQMENGTVLVEETDDLGHIYVIKSNVATAATETIMQLHDGVTIQVAVPVAAGNVLTALLNPWAETIISPASINTAANAGVSRVIIAASGWGWTQTRGVASCLFETDATGGALLLGNTCRAANEVAGAVSILDETAGDAEYQHVGYAMETAPTADFGHIFLTIE
jgi:hypothetical protein